MRKHWRRFRPAQNILRQPSFTSLSLFFADLRLVRFDELPRISNVLRGDMRIVGPRAQWSRIVAEHETKTPATICATW